MQKEIVRSNTAISMADFYRSKSALDADKVLQTISFTKFIDTDKKTAKSYELVDGVITKLTAGNFYNGTFETININYTELPNYIKSMEAGEFIVQGVHQSLPSGNCPADATRAKDLFPFADQAGLLIIDSDSINQFNGIANYDDLTTALNIIEPALSPAMKFCISSASSYVEYNGENSGLRGVHTYIPVDTTLDNKAIIETLHARSVIAGYAYPKITKSGSVKINSFIDTALKTSNQPVFEGGAILKDPAITQIQQYQTYEGHLLIANSIKPLTDSENTAYKMIVADLKESVAEQASTIRSEYLKNKGIAIKEKCSKVTHKQAAGIVKRAVIDNDLYGQFTIRLGKDKEVTVQEILDNKAEYHGVACFHPLDNDIYGKSLIYSDQNNPCIHTFAHGEEVFYLNPDVAQWELDLLDHVELFNENHTQVILGGKHKIMRSLDPIIHPDNRATNEYLDIKELKQIYANDLIQVDIKKTRDGNVPVYKDKISAWAYHRKCCVYTGGVYFRPSINLPENFYNLWQGFAVTPCLGASIARITYHIEHVICNEDTALIKYIYDWIAFTVQHPQTPVGSALVLRGEKGSGKGVLGHFIRKLWGTHGMHISNPVHLVGKFNSHLADLCFLFADEAFFSGDKQHENILKALITEPVMQIERKGIDSISQPNYLKVFMATNSEYAVPASKDERRYCVFDVSSARINDDQYFRALVAECNDKKAQAAFLDTMLKRDVSLFAANAIPETLGLKDQRLHSLPAHGQWLADCLVQGYISTKFQYLSDTGTYSWKTEITTKFLHDSFLDWCEANKKTQYDIINIQTLGKYLGKIFSSTKIKDARGVRFGTLRQAISAFEEYEKVDLGIEHDAKIYNFDDYCNKNADIDLAPTIVKSNMLECVSISVANSSYIMN